MVTKRIIVGLFFVAGCAAEGSEAGRDAPIDSARDTRGAEVPTPPAPALDPTPDPAPGQGGAGTGDGAGAEPPLLSWGFEPASADCNGWPVLGADAIRATPARSGGYSCKLCSNGTAEGLGIVRDLGAVPAGRYVLSAWVRRRVQNAAPGEALARMDAETADGQAVSAVAPSVVVRDEWDRLEATIDLAEGASKVRLTIGSALAETDRCLFVDDVSVVRVR